MAPRATPKATPRVKTLVVGTNAGGGIGVKPRSSQATPKKLMPTKKPTEKVSLKGAKAESRQRTNTVPNVATPKNKAHKPVSTPASVTRTAKKATWKRRPKPAHSGVPVPEKMKQLLQMQLLQGDPDGSL